MRRAAVRLSRSTELAAARADARRVALLAEAVSENARQDVLLRGVLADLERSLIPVLTSVVEESR